VEENAQARRDIIQSQRRLLSRRPHFPSHRVLVHYRAGRRFFDFLVYLFVLAFSERKITTILVIPAKAGIFEDTRLPAGRQAFAGVTK
jgi:hypothetical protein